MKYRCLCLHQGEYCSQKYIGLDLAPTELELLLAVYILSAYTCECSTELQRFLFCVYGPGLGLVFRV